MNYKKIATRLSTDKPFENLNVNMPFPDIGAKFVIYANGTRWYLDCWGSWSLYWIPGKEPVEIPPECFLAYKCTWLSDNRHISNIERIIWKHPNCTNWKWRWMPARIIKFLWRVGFRFTGYG